MKADAFLLIERAHAAEEAGDHHSAVAHLAGAHAAGRNVKRVHVHVHWLMASFFARRRQLGSALREAALAVLATLFDRDREEREPSLELSQL
jgi:hypothetical protein